MARCSAPPQPYGSCAARAPRAVTSLRLARNVNPASSQGSMNRQVISKWTAIVLGAVVALELVYVAAAKVLLSKLPSLASYEALQVTYSDAGSWFPGRAWVRDFVVSGHDSNIQFEVRVKEARVTVSLLDLFSKHFHATEAITSGVEFRMRHNVEKLEGQERRIAAFPTIRGYAGPPVYPEVPDGPPGPPEDAWLIELERVTAQVNDVWVLEYHYAGNGTAKGGFFLNPGRAFHLRPSEFTWEGGALLVGDTPVAREARGVVRSEIHLDDVQAIQGMNFTDDVKVEMDLRLQRGELDFLNVYAGSLPIAAPKGDYSLELGLRAEQGRLLDGNRVRWTFDDVSFAAAKTRVVSSGTLEVGAKHDPTEPLIHVVPFELAVEKTVLTIDGERSKPLSATLVSRSARLLTDKPSTTLQATVDARLQPGDALLEPLLGETPAAITKAFLELPELVTRVAVYLTEGRSRVELLKLDAGDLEASGAWQDRPAGGTGGFSVKTALADIGIALDGSQVSWDLE